MSLKCRVLESGVCDITFPFSKSHKGVDIVSVDAKGNHVCSSIMAHTEGEVIDIRTNCKGHEGDGSYGNYVKLKHPDGYCTFYAHMKYGTIKVKKGDKVKEKQVLGFMGDTGYAFGAHLHFELRTAKGYKNDPTPYLDKNLPDMPTPKPSKWQVGDYVSIDGVYVSSTSLDKLKPKVNHGKITKIINAKNPYLLNDGGIGWVNDDCITGRYDEGSLLVLVKNTIRGDYGNGDVRKQRLGGRYEEVQRQVNLNYKFGTTAPDKVRIY